MNFSFNILAVSPGFVIQVVVNYARSAKEAEDVAQQVRMILWQCRHISLIIFHCFFNSESIGWFSCIDPCDLCTDRGDGRVCPCRRWRYVQAGRRRCPV